MMTFTMEVQVIFQVVDMGVNIKYEKMEGAREGVSGVASSRP